MPINRIRRHFYSVEWKSRTAQDISGDYMASPSLPQALAFSQLRKSVVGEFTGDQLSRGINTVESVFVGGNTDVKQIQTIADK